MFEQLYKAPYALARHLESPLAEQRRRYLVHCNELKLAITVQRSIASYLLSITEYLNLGERPDELISPIEIAAQADRWAKRGTRRRRTLGHPGAANISSHTRLTG